jgi:hypothetical protein
MLHRSQLTKTGEHFDGTRCQAARNARAKSIRAEIDKVIVANIPESDNDEAASLQAKPALSRRAS